MIGADATIPWDVGFGVFGIKELWFKMPGKIAKTNFAHAYTDLKIS